MKNLILAITLLTTLPAFAEKSTTEKINEAGDSGLEKTGTTARKASSETKKALRKIGRKSMDAACELQKTAAECAAQKAEHEAATKKEEVEGVSPY